MTGVKAIRTRFHTQAYDMHAHNDEWMIGVTRHALREAAPHHTRHLNRQAVEAIQRVLMSCKGMPSKTSFSCNIQKYSGIDRSIQASGVKADNGEA